MAGLFMSLLSVLCIFAFAFAFVIAAPAAPAAPTASSSPVHIISFNGAGCSGSSYTTQILKQLLTHNGFKPCSVDAEVLRVSKFSKLIPNGDKSDKVRSVLRHCSQRENATAVVFDISGSDTVTAEKHYKNSRGSFPVYQFHMYRSNLLYLKICHTMDFGNNANSYKVLNGKKVEMSFWEGRKRPPNVTVHIDPQDLMSFIRSTRHKHSSVIKKYAHSFTMEDLFAYEYGNQFALRSVHQWEKIANICNLQFNDFFHQYMMEHVNTRLLRESSDIIENFEEVATVLRENRMEYYMIPAVKK
jgi:hypothetical protein